MIKLKLAYPPTANHYLKQGRNGRRYLTKKAIEYHYLTKLDTAQQLSRDFNTINNPAIMRVIAVPPDHRKRDVTNLEKVLKDSLERAGVYTDDNLIWDFSIKWDHCRS
jgi:crossover junction endodeoxyribonuclease RusA